MRRYQFGLFLLAGFFVLATLFAVLLYVFIPETPATRGPLLLAAFVAILLGGLLCILFILRWLFRPYRELVGEAEKASLATADRRHSQDEAEFVLETFQSVVAQLQKQREVLEQLRTEASKRAASAEQFSERIVASVPSGLIAFDGSGRSIVINGPGRNLLEVDDAAAGQMATELLARIPQLATMVQQCLDAGTLYRREEIEMETNAGLRRLGATVAPINISPEQNERGALCLLTDITEVTELREQVALKKNLESLGEMSAGLAHEFKNAIAALQGYVQLIQSLELDEKGKTVAASLLGEVRNLSEMVTSFLNFARPQPLQLDQVDLVELVRECETELTPLLNARKVELLIEHATAPIQVPADERMLRQTLLNLMRNGAEAIPESDNRRRVVVDVSRAHENGGNYAIVTIQDTGPGIPAAQMQKIFIPFFTTKPSGHGIGLALAHRVVSQHGGELTVTNNDGARFTLRLPG